MTPPEVTLDATLDAGGTLRLSSPPPLPPGPVRVTIRPAGPSPSGLADVLRAIVADQRARGFPGRPSADVQAEDAARDDDDRDRELDAARGGAASGGP